MVGAKKIILDLEALKDPVLQELLNQYHVVQISCEGSKEHTKAGISKEKVLVKAYSKRQGENKSE